MKNYCYNPHQTKIKGYMSFIKLSIGSITAKRFIKYFLQTALILNFALGEVFAKESEDSEYKYNYNQFNGKCSVYDPYEKLNRKIFAFNSVVDTFLLRPVAKIYGRFTNDYTKNRVGSFVDNISEPLSTVNYTLQGNPEGILKSFWRFAINSTFGIAGMFDIASKFGLKPPQQTLGSTLAYYGTGPGPYIVLPFYGGINARDVSDPLISDFLLNPLTYSLDKNFMLTVTGVSIIDMRYKLMPLTDYVSKNSSDPYIAVREAVFNQREAKIIYPAGYKCQTFK